MENPLHVAPNGKVALDMLLGRGMPALSPVPQIILLDLDLPEMTGLDFLTELRKNHFLKACLVFVMTGQGNRQDILHAYELNVAGYILKPFQYASFKETIDTLHSFWSLIELPH